MTRPSIGLVRVIPAVCPSRSRRTITCTPRVRRSSGLADGSSSRRSSSHQGPVAFTTTAARTCPWRMSSSSTTAPRTWPPLRSRPMTRVYVATSAPCSIAERTVATTRRASSHCAS